MSNESASSALNIDVNEENKWRLETPGSESWERSPRAGAEKKTICHVRGHSRN